MRTRLTIDAQLMTELEALAQRRNVPLDLVVDQVLRRGPEAGATRRKPFRARTFAMGQPLVPSLDKSLSIAAGFEDDETARSLKPMADGRSAD